jgi:hypothetical protein
MLYEIVTPCDPYTFRAPTLAVAAVALLFLTEWKGAGKPLDGEGPETPFFPFGCTQKAMEEQILELTGGTLQAFIDANKNAIADSLASVLIGSQGDRGLFEEAVSRMPESERASFREQWHDRKRSSISDFGKRAQQLAAHFRAA